MNFNSHTREGVTVSIFMIPTYFANFNSHTREGVTNYTLDNSIMWGISTHTPVRVWPNNAVKSLHFIGFQLTHPWGCDCVFWRTFCGGFWFQLTHPWGCDGRDKKKRAEIFISTHTPVRVWPFHSGTEESATYFNSHTREGVTLGVKIWKRSIFYFNSHTREGVTLLHMWDPCRFHFNSHTREGVTLRRRGAYALGLNFNSHTREGVTGEPDFPAEDETISTHTPVRVWLVLKICLLKWKIYFNSHTREGVTMFFRCSFRCKYYFNSHTREGVTLRQCLPAE